MKARRHIYGLGLAASAPLALFLAQTWLVTKGQPEAVLALARYSGLLALIFFLFDGSSGLAGAIMRLRHSPRAIRSAYRRYRLGVLAFFALLLPLAWSVAPLDTAGLAPLCVLALFLRLPFLDAELDRKNMQHWAMLLQNGWMIPLAFVAIIGGQIGPLAAGHCALWSSLVYAGFHIFSGPSVRSAPSAGHQGDVKEPLRDLLHFMATNGIGQVYGRGVLIVFGAGPVSPATSLIVYAKQVFNASGPVIAYLRRVELQGEDRTFSMRLSLWGQGAVLAPATIVMAFAAMRLGVSPVLFLLVMAWQLAERLSSTSIYAFQVAGRHDLAYAGLIAVSALGSIGLAIVAAGATPMVFLSCETLGFAAALTLWFSQKGQHHSARGATR